MDAITLSLVLQVIPIAWVSCNPLLIPEDKNLRLSTIVNQYHEWDLVVHTDKADFLNLLGHQKPTSNPVTIFKYEAFDARRFRRPPYALHVVNFVVHANHDVFLDYTRLEGNIAESDIIIFLSATLYPDADYNYLYESGVDNANMAFFINRTMALAIFFYNSAQPVADVQLVRRDARDVPELSRYRNGFRNFRGFPLTIGYSNCPPFIYHNEANHLVGVEYKVLEIVLNALNITPHMVDYSNKRNARIKLIRDVNASVLHFGIGCLSNNIRRNEMVAFSAAVQTEPHITLFATSPKYEQSALYALVSPLHPYVWMCCIFTLIIVSITIKLLIIFEMKNVHVNPILISLEILLEQSTYIPSRSNALRFGLFSWILVGLSLSSSYKSKLTAALIMPSTREPERLGQLLSEGYKFISPAEDSTYLIELLQFSSDRVEYEIGKQLEDTKLVCDAIEQAINQHAAVIEERTVIRYKLWNECSKNLTEKQLNSLRRIQSDTTVNGHLWAMPKAAPYKNRVSEVLEILKSYGLTNKWYQSYNLTKSVPISNSVQKRGDTEPLELADIVSAYIVLGFGSFLGAIAFIGEKCLASRSRLHRHHSMGSAPHWISMHPGSFDTPMR